MQLRPVYLGVIVFLSAACGGLFGSGDGDSQPVRGAHDEDEPAYQPRAEAAPTPSSALPPAIASLSDGELKAADGSVISLHGQNWFGLNVAEGPKTLHGLWTNDVLSGDFATVVWRQKALGFNAVRLPFSFSLFDQKPQDFSFGCQPLTADALAAATRDPQAQGDAKPLPPLPKEPDRSSGKCNGYLPLGSVREQFLYIVKFYVDNGFYVLADNHLREDPTATDNQQAWVDGWAAVAADLEAYEPARGRVLFDLLNEPGEKGIKWDKLGGMYLAAMDAIWAKSQSFPLAIEGTGQDAIDAGWGDGFSADPAHLSIPNMSDPTAFFAALAGKPYAERVLLVPHVYGPSVTNGTRGIAGQQLFDRLDASFGAQRAKGLSAGGKSTRFPVAIGEFGSKFESEGDKTWLTDFAAYLTHEGAAAAAQGGPIRNWFYWDWNADSGDTGGLVADDWKTLQWEKLRYLFGLGLTPWYAAAAVASPAPVKTAEAAAQPKVEAPSPPTSPGPPPASPASSAPPPTAAAPGPPPHPPAAAETTTVASHPVAVELQDSPPSRTCEAVCQVRASVDHQWQAENTHFAALNLFLNQVEGIGAEVPFTIEAFSANYSQLIQAWNMEDTKLEANAVKGTVKAEWANLIPGAHNLINVGFIVSGPGADFLPTQVAINGRKCQAGQSDT